MALATVDHQSLVLTETPTFEQIHAWWEEMWSTPDDLQVAFSDLMPRALPAFLESDVLLVLVCAGSSCVTAVWLHDLKREHGHVTSGWIGGWIAPVFRGPVGVTAVKMALALFQERGLRHIFSAIHRANRASIALTVGRSMLGFTRVTIAQAFLPYGGTLTDCLISTWKAEDVERAKAAVTTRAHHVARLIAREAPPMETETLTT
jgi:RimJ/RimL family protein N-acetyltransferase